MYFSHTLNIRYILRSQQLTKKIMIEKPISEKYQSFKAFKKGETCLPNSWIVVRLDGKGFREFTDLHVFEKPNDIRGLELMNRAAAKVMEEFRDICLAFGQSDEYSFIFKKDSLIFDRCRHTISTIVNSVFTTAYLYYWKDYFGYVKLLRPPSFDSRVIVYPSDTNLKDYLSWRQADVHINNLYNTVFWALVNKGNHARREAEKILCGTLSKDKNEILFKAYGINYNNEPSMFRKGTTLIKKLIPDESNTMHLTIVKLDCDIMREKFWHEHPEILGMKSLQVFHKPLLMVGYRAKNHLNLDTEFQKETKLTESVV